jgi:hypothetical protein
VALSHASAVAHLAANVISASALLIDDYVPLEVQLKMSAERLPSLACSRRTTYFRFQLTKFVERRFRVMSHRIAEISG